MAIAFFIVFLGSALFLQQAALSLFLGISLSYVNNKLSLTPVSVNGSLFLKAGIICLGGTISLTSLGTISLDYIPLVSIYVIAIMIVGILIGKLIRLPKNLTLLLVSAGRHTQIFLPNKVTKLHLTNLRKRYFTTLS